MVSGAAVKWQPTFGANNLKITHMGKNKPDCYDAEMDFKLRIVTQGRELKLAVSNSKNVGWGQSNAQKQMDCQKLLGKTQQTK